MEARFASHMPSYCTEDWKGWMETPEGGGWGNAGRGGWGEPREGVEETERTHSGRRGPHVPQRLVIQNSHFSTTHIVQFSVLHNDRVC
ncbi:hypothetical protein TNCV_2711341 [Trichonephila clavipes]|nr:hypothetical protein TNCV_2711341 [Trichonephila clavipes]